MTRNNLEAVSEHVAGNDEASDVLVFSLSDAPLSILQEELKVEQRVDTSLKGLFDLVLHAGEEKK